MGPWDSFVHLGVLFGFTNLHACRWNPHEGLNVFSFLLFAINGSKWRQWAILCPSAPESIRSVSPLSDTMRKFEQQIWNPAFCLCWFQSAEQRLFSVVVTRAAPHRLRCRYNVHCQNKDVEIKVRRARPRVWLMPRTSSSAYPDQTFMFPQLRRSDRDLVHKYEAFVIPTKTT